MGTSTVAVDDIQPEKMSDCENLGAPKGFLCQSRNVYSFRRLFIRGVYLFVVFIYSQTAKKGWLEACNCFILTCIFFCSIATNCCVSFSFILLVVSTDIACCYPFGNNYERVVLLLVSTDIACCCFFSETTMSVLYSRLFPQG